MRSGNSEEQAGTADPVEQARRCAERDFRLLAGCISGELDPGNPGVEAAFARLKAVVRSGGWKDGLGSGGVDRFLAIYGRFV